ncbi:hypothetical protein NL676_034924 [Syzygium grande]|nr:hypothetical protein NL676_034924 [Syzygium grande]
MEPPLKATTKPKQVMAALISAAKAPSKAKSGKPKDSSQPMAHVDHETQKIDVVGTSIALPKHPTTINVGISYANRRPSPSDVAANSKAQDPQDRRCPEPSKETIVPIMSLPHPTVPLAPSPVEDEPWQVNSPTRVMVNMTGPSGLPLSPRNGDSSSSDSGDEDVANDMSSDSDSPSPGQRTPRLNVPLQTGPHVVSIDPGSDLLGLKPLSLDMPSSGSGKDGNADALPALIVVDPAPVCKPIASALITPRSKRRGGAKKR